MNTEILKLIANFKCPFCKVLLFKLNNDTGMCYNNSCQRIMIKYCTPIKYSIPIKYNKPESYSDLYIYVKIYMGDNYLYIYNDSSVNMLYWMDDKDKPINIPVFDVFNYSKKELKNKLNKYLIFT